jgi:hypothetical protein
MINMDCKEQSDNGTCTACRKYYKLTNGECVPTGLNPKCSYYNKENVCEYCYYPSKYYLDNNNICQEKNPNCAQINTQNGDCTKCEKGYTLSNGECLTS